ncbi:MAG TPA: hypothetical protein VFV66_05530 [Nonomuraea sp.]|nr:hypothetical protein [Nonomuraea sp.]
MGTAEPEEMAVAGVAAPVATMVADATGEPAALTAPSAATVLAGVICAVAVNTGVAVGWWISQVRVAAEFGLGCAAGGLISIESATVDVGLSMPWPQV